MAERFRPFPEIPHDRDYEGIRDLLLPAAQDSVFFDSVEKAVIGDPQLLQAVEAGRIFLPAQNITESDSQDAIAFLLVAKFVLAGNSVVEKGSRFSHLQDFCRSNFPSDYEKVLAMIHMQMGKVDQSSQVAVDQLYQELKPPEYFRARWYFQAHALGDNAQSASLKQELKEQMEQIFVKGGKNICFLEETNSPDSAWSKGSESIFQKGFELYHSFRKAAVYHDLCSANGKEPTQEQIEVSLGTLYLNLPHSQHPTANMMRYRLAFLELLDEYMNAGYEISVIHEKILRKPLDTTLLLQQSGLVKDNLSLDDYKKATIRLNAAFMKNAKERDELVVSQVESLVKLTETKGQKTNFFGLRGSLHNRLISYLPVRIQAVTDYTISKDTYLPENGKPIHEVDRRLAEGESIPDSLWEEARKAWDSL